MEDIMAEENKSRLYLEVNYYLLRRAWDVCFNSLKGFYEYEDKQGRYVSETTYNKIFRESYFPNDSIRSELKKKLRLSDEIFNGKKLLQIPTSEKVDYNYLTIPILEKQWERFFDLREKTGDSQNGELKQEKREYKELTKSIDKQILNVLNDIDKCISEDVMRLVFALKMKKNEEIIYKNQVINDIAQSPYEREQFIEAEISRKSASNNLLVLHQSLNSVSWRFVCEAYQKHLEQKGKNSIDSTDYERYKASLKRQLDLLETVEKYYLYKE